MAFDHDDTDAIYDNVIAPTLKGMGIDVFRVDRVEHNDDIDDAIIEGIQSSDFMVADLTYARPSVYFEAGYAARKVPVIYTSRRDHFKGKAGDKYGNFRVHFDLAMKNIIAWSKPTDKTFPTRLKRRINFVLAPLRKKREKDELEAQRRDEFFRLSVHQKNAAAIDVAKRVVKELGYQAAVGVSSGHDTPTFFVKKRPVKSMAFGRARGGELSSLYIFADERFAVPHAGELRLDAANEHLNLNSENRMPDKIVTRYVVLTPNRLSDVALAKRLPECGVYPAKDEFRHTGSYWLPPKQFFQHRAEIFSRGRGYIRFEMKGTDPKTYLIQDGSLLGHGGKVLGKAVLIPRQVSFHFIDNFKDPEEIEARLQAALAAPER